MNLTAVTLLCVVQRTPAYMCRFGDAGTLPMHTGMVNLKLNQIEQIERSIAHWHST